MANYQQNQNSGQDRERESVPDLKLSAEQLHQISEMTKRDDFLAFDDGEIEMILDLCPQCYLADFRRFIYRASGLGLNPLHNEIHMEYKWSRGKAKATFVVHIDGFRKMADRTGLRAGFSQKPGVDERGEYVETTIWRKDCQQPFIARVYFHEFMQAGEYSLYKTKPYHMVAKCGEAFGYKQAFPVSGMSTEDEIDAWPTDQGPRLDRDVAIQPTPTPTSNGTSDAYAVVEKSDKQDAPAAVSTPAPVPPPAPAAPPVQAPTPAPLPVHQQIAARLKALGVTKPEMTDWTNFYFRYPDRKLLADDYVEAFGKAEDWIKEHGIEKFRAGIVESRDAHAVKGTADAAPVPVPAPVEDTVVMAASKQVEAKFPRWSPELTRVAALWCADQVKDAGTLEAFLLTAGLTSTTPPGKIESLLAISRHMAMSSGLAILEYSKASQLPLSQIEAELGAKVGQPIRFAVDLPQNAVTDAFAAMQEALKAKAK